jgi:hypothetical protein
VYSAKEVIIEWAIGAGKTTGPIKGRADSGRVKVTPIGNILKIIIRESDVDVARPTLELQEEVAKFCEITDPSHVAILHWILAEDDLKEIEDVLQRRGIPNDLPEFDKLTQDVTEDQSVRLSFSGLNARSLDLESEYSLQRPYKGPEKDSQGVLLVIQESEKSLQRRYEGSEKGSQAVLPDKQESENSLQRPYKGPKKDSQEVLPDKQESVDAIQSFVNKFNFASSFGKEITRSWQDVEPKTMLSHICRLENMDPFMLLPQRESIWERERRKAGGYPDDYFGVIFNEKPTTDSIKHTVGSRTFPATVRVTAKGHIKVGVSSTATNLTDEEILFAGELYVRIQIMNMIPARALNTK